MTERGNHYIKTAVKQTQQQEPLMHRVVDQQVKW